MNPLHASYTVVTQNGSKCFDSISDVIYPREPHYIKLIQAHGECATACILRCTRFINVPSPGSMMIVAWCVLVPCAILLALFYKTVCFRGEWFYVRIQTATSVCQLLSPYILRSIRYTL